MDQETAEKLIAALEKLNADVNRLRSDVAILSGRLMRSEGELPKLAPDYEGPIRTQQDAFNAISKARQGVEGVEFHIKALRSIMDQIKNNVVARAEFIDYITDAGARPKE